MVLNQPKVKAEETVEKESKLYRLKEMHDSMQQSLDNIADVRTQQIALVKLLEEHASERFATFIDELKAQIKKIDEQTESLVTKFKTLTNIITICETNKEYDSLCNMLLDVFSIFD